MAGGLYQTVAQGAQNLFLNASPEVTFFYALYKRHSTFAIESMENTFNGTVGFGNRITCQVSHNADLMWRTYLQVDVSSMTGSGSSHVAWAKNLGYTMIDKVEVEIGGQIIDTHYGDYLSIKKELSTPVGHISTLDNMIGNVVEMNDITSPSTTSTPARRLYIPLEFWFCNNPGLALPLVALPYQDVKINVTFKPVSQLYLGTPVAVPTITACSLYVDYIYLDVPERNRLAESQLEYLIDQVQQQSESITASTFRSRLSFNHPCHDMIWVVQPTANISANDWTNYTNAGGHTVSEAHLQLNGQDRMTKRPGEYFNLVQPFQHYTNGPSIGIYAYSFALKPESYEPSGSCNFSKIDNSNLVLSLTTSDATLRVYARNKNILRFRQGMSGIAYAS